MQYSVALAACLLVAGCTTRTPEIPMIWVRTDGQTVKDNPALSQQFEVDRTVCDGEMQKANLSGTQICRGVVDCAVQSNQRSSAMFTIGKGCMAQRGYVLMPEDQAPAYREAARAAQPKAASAKR